MLGHRTWLVLPLLWIGCTKDDDFDPAAACQDPPIDWTNTGQPFLVTWCQSCHGSQQVDEARLGAPAHVRFDSLFETREHAVSIQSRVVAGTMPPATTVPQEAIDPFVLWLSCGLPGVDIAPEPPGPCDAVQPFPGDLRVSEAGGDFCDQYSGVGGDLVIDAESAVLDCLCDVSGTITIEGFTGSEVALPVLTHAAGLVAVGEPTLATLHFPLLGTMEQSLHLSDLPALVTAEFPLLDKIVGDLIVEQAPLLQAVGVHRLKTIDGDLRLVESASLDFLLPFDLLDRVGGDVELRALGLTEPRPFRRVVEIGGGLAISGNDQMVWLKGFDVLASVGGDFGIADHAVLAEIQAMPLLEYVGGDFYLGGNPLLDPQDARNLRDGIDEIVGTATLGP